MSLESSVEKLSAARRKLAENRLSAIEVQECSLVDRAANKRTWLITKRAHGTENGRVFKTLFAKAEAENAATFKLGKLVFATELLRHRGDADAAMQAVLARFAGGSP